MNSKPAAELLIGTWELVSYEAHRADGTRYEPLGPKPLGVLIYGADGHMSAQLARRGRDALGDRAPRNATDSIAYSGTYAVNGAGTAVAHHVSVSLEPEWIGRTLHRSIHLEGDLLVLVARVSAHCESSRHELSWRRVTGA
jgi:hypothetical protein